jgi:hypothetical protein
LKPPGQFQADYSARFVKQPNSKNGYGLQKCIITKEDTSAVRPGLTGGTKPSRPRKDHRLEIVPADHTQFQLFKSMPKLAQREGNAVPISDIVHGDLQAQTKLPDD